MKTTNTPFCISRHRAGFTLLEIIIAVSVIAILAGAIALRAGGLIGKSQVSKVLQNIEAFKSACTMYTADTGDIAREYAGYPAASRNLSGTQTIAGWNGPYLEKPLTHEDNPWGWNHIYDYSTVHSNAGFDLDGDGTLDVTGSASTYVMQGVPAKEAKSINDALDNGIPGSWESTGRVNYNSTSKRLWILLYY